MEEVIVIANPGAGRGDAPERALALIRALSEGGSTCRLLVTERLEDATDFAASARGAAAVVAVGGDGTLGAVVEGSMRVPAPSRPPLAVLFNGAHDAAPRGHEAAVAAAIHTSRPRATDVGYLPDRDRYFASTVVLRSPAEVLRDGPRHDGRVEILVQRSSEPPPAFADVRGVDVTLESDGSRQRLRAHALVIGNVALAGDGDGGGGRLEVVGLLRGSTPSDLPHRARSILDARPAPGDIRHRVREASLSTSELMVVEVDGEPAGGTPVTVRLVPNAIRLYLPPVRERVRARGSGGALPVRP